MDRTKEQGARNKDKPILNYWWVAWTNLFVRGQKRQGSGIEGAMRSGERR